MRNNSKCYKEKPQLGAGVLRLPRWRFHTISRIKRPFGAAPLAGGAAVLISIVLVLYGLRGLFYREMQYALVEMSVDGSVLWLEWQGYRTVE